MINFERERASQALSLRQNRSGSPENWEKFMAFQVGRSGIPLSFPTNKTAETPFKLGLDFRLKRLGMDDKYSAEDIFKNGEFFTKGFLTKLAIHDADPAEEPIPQDIVAIYNIMLNGRSSSGNTNWSSFAEGAIFALQALQHANLKEMGNAMFAENGIFDQTNTLKLAGIRQELKEEERNLQQLVAVAISEDQTKTQSTTNTEILKELRKKIQDIPSIDPPTPNLKPISYK